MTHGFNLPSGACYDCEPGYDEDLAREEWEEEWAEEYGSTVEPYDEYCDMHPEDDHDRP